MSAIYFIIFVLFVVYIVFVWNSTKEFDTIVMRISYFAVGTLAITIITLVLFWISKIGVVYPKQEMVGEVRRIILLVFIPINGFVILTQFSSIVAQIRSGIVAKEDMEKRIKRIIIILVVMIVIECIYFKNIQTGLIEVINAKK